MLHVVHMKTQDVLVPSLTHVDNYGPEFLARHPRRQVSE